MAKSKRVLLVQAQYLGGLAIINAAGAVVAAYYRNVFMMAVGLCGAAVSLWGRGRRRRQADEAVDP